MNYIRNFFGWGAQKNIDNAQPNKVEKEFDGFEIFEKSQLTAPEQNYISKALNIRNMSNNIVSGIKKITSGVLDIVSCANPFNKVPVNNKTSQQKASMLLDNKNIQDLTKKIKRYYGIDVAYLKNKKGHLNVKDLVNLMKENQILFAKIESLKRGKPKNFLESQLNTLKVSANLCLISKNNAEILHNYVCLACAKASNEGRDKQQMQYLFQVNDIAEKMAKKYENHAKEIVNLTKEFLIALKRKKNLDKKRNELEAKRRLNQNANKRNLNKKNSGKKDAMLKRPGISNKRKNMSTTKLPKEIVDNYDKPHALKNYINSKPFEDESTEESSTLSDIDTNSEFQALEDNINAGTIKNGSIEDSNIFDDIDIDSVKNGYDKAKAKYDEQNKLMNEQKKELSKLRKEHGRINKFFAQYAQNDVSNEEIDKELEELGKKLKESQADTVPNSEEYINIELEKIEKEVENELKNQL